MKLNVDGIGEVILSPTGAQALAEMLEADRAGQLVSIHRIHPATRSRLHGQGFIANWMSGPADRVTLTPEGYRVAEALDATSLTS